MRILATLVVLLLSTPAWAQAYLTPVVPRPYDAVPPGPSGLGVIGSGDQYIPWNGQQRQGVQRTVTATDSGGNFSVTWNWAFVSSTPTVTTQAGNPGGSLPIVCNWQTRSQTGMTGKCWQTNLVSLTLAIVTAGLSVNVFASPPATNTPVSVIMAEPTQ